MINTEDAWTVCLKLLPEFERIFPEYKKPAEALALISNLENVTEEDAKKALSLLRSSYKMTNRKIALVPGWAQASYIVDIFITFVEAFLRKNRAKEAKLAAFEDKFAHYKEIYLTQPHILFRSSNLENEKELEIAKKYFSCFRYRSQAPLNSRIIARYSALPFYAELEADLASNNSVLINSYAQHCWISSFSWYYDLADVTPQSWFDNDFYQCQDLGPFIVKGRTNSRKHQWNRLMFAPTKQAAVTIASDLMSDPLISEQGVVYRKYIPLRSHETCPISGLPFAHEFRLFFYKDILLTHGYYWSSAANVSRTISEKGLQFGRAVAERVAEHANFFVLDIAERADTPDEWILIEINDGQQSGPSECNLDELYKNLAEAISHKDLLL